MLHRAKGGYTQDKPSSYPNCTYTVIESLFHVYQGPHGSLDLPQATVTFAY